MNESETLREIMLYVTERLYDQKVAMHEDWKIHNPYKHVYNFIHTDLMMNNPKYRDIISTMHDIGVVRNKIEYPMLGTRISAKLLLKASMLCNKGLLLTIAE